MGGCQTSSSTCSRIKQACVVNSVRLRRSSSGSCFTSAPFLTIFKRNVLLFNKIKYIIVDDVTFLLGEVYLLFTEGVRVLSTLYQSKFPVQESLQDKGVYIFWFPCKTTGCIFREIERGGDKRLFVTAITYSV